MRRSVWSRRFRGVAAAVAVLVCWTAAALPAAAATEAGFSGSAELFAGFCDCSLNLPGEYGEAGRSWTRLDPGSLAPPASSDDEESDSIDVGSLLLGIAFLGLLFWFMSENYTGP